MPSGWLKERALGGSSLGRGEDAWFCSPPRRPARRRHTPHAARRPTPAPCPSRSPARRARAALVPGSARPASPPRAARRVRAAATRPVASHPRPAAQRSRRTASGRAAQRPPLAPRATFRSLSRRPCAPSRACTRQRPPRRARAARRARAPPPRAAQRPPLAPHRAPRRASAPTAPNPAPALPTRSESAQINSNFPYLVKKFLDGLRFTSYLSQLHFFADSRILLKEERPRGPRKNR